MAYIPDWEPLADALKRVMASGVSEDEAKTDLCRAVADRKIDVRVRIEKLDRARGGQVFSDGNVGVPAHLNPADFDWERSRPTARWPIGPRLGEHYTWIRGWEDWMLELIELSTADVIAVLCGDAGAAAEPTIQSGKQKSGGKSQPAFERARNAINELYPDGAPGQAQVPNASLCRRVAEKLKQAKLPDVSDDTILRAAGRRRK